MATSIGAVGKVRPYFLEFPTSKRVLFQTSGLYESFLYSSLIILSSTTEGQFKLACLADS
jgi:hypothetical protein